MSINHEEDEEEQEVVVKDPCMGKKSAAIVWYDRRSANLIKRHKATKCTKGTFKLTFKEKKKDLNSIEIQTAFYD